MNKKVYDKSCKRVSGIVCVDVYIYIYIDDLGLIK